MGLLHKFESFHAWARNNRWMVYFSIFLRIALAFGFITSGMVKILGERFTALPVTQPMGAYLEALYHTGYYYTFIGIAQVTAAILLLIPRTATLGAILYFPIILNICVLSLSVRFEGSLISSPLMVLGVTYLLCWDYHKLKWALPWYHQRAKNFLPSPETKTKTFPWKFALTGFIIIIGLGFTLMNIYELRPYNMQSECKRQCNDTSNPKACIEFCKCIHQEGNPLPDCLEKFEAN